MVSNIAYSGQNPALKVGLSFKEGEKQLNDAFTLLGWLEAIQMP